MSDYPDWLRVTLKDIKNCSNINSLEQLKSKVIGKNSDLFKELSQLSTLSNTDKKIKGPLLNQYKVLINDSIKSKKQELQKPKYKNYFTDPSLPTPENSIGTLHPISLAFIKAINFFKNKNFIISDGPEIETTEFNFTKLNLDENHPARDELDTFYFDEELLLRTHTSSVQIRTMLNNKPPLRVISPGRVYRRDSDPTHTPMFHQLEGFLVSENANFSNLKSTIKEFLNYFFEKDVTIRLRPSYFPFTEPSAEIDIKCMSCETGCSICKNTTWLEVLGCGMINPKVLDNVGIDTDKYQGWAFGFGIDRLVMIKYNIPDLRLMFTGNLDFIKQFKSLNEIF